MKVKDGVGEGAEVTAYNKAWNRLTDWHWWFGLPPKHMKVAPRKTWEVTVVIPAFNEAKSIGMTVLSIQRQTFPVREIIVVDDCSTDGTGEIAQRFGVTVLRTPRNSGTKSQALNYALRRIQSEFVCIVDGDTILERDALEKVLPAFHIEKVVAACGYVVPQRIKSFWERARFIEYIVGIAIYKRAQNHIGAVFVCSGCFALFRKSAIDGAGLFRERTIAEDMDLTWELLDKGKEVAFVGEAMCYPVDPPSFSILVAQLNRWYCGYLQCMKVRRGRFRNWKLGLLAYWYILDFMFGWVTFVVGLSLYTGSLFRGGSIALLLQVLLLFSVCSVKGFMMGRLRTVLVSFFCYFPILIINACVLWRALWLEIILGRNLGKWQKGH
ncbi:MAG: glycosyltransferase family 2 protein [Candidatus Moraniibacteriota bacterium]|nr:MAG: glycosyltransferase family 2 protein [Candidatus Moranbacteria bacterium]